MFLIYPFTLSHEHRHHRHHRHAYSEMTLAVYYCSKQKQWYYEKTRNQNDADDANDAEFGIWYRDILKTASQESSASLSSRKNSAGVWGTPQKCACGWPHAMLAKHVYPQNGDYQTRHPYKFAYAPEWISLDSSKNLDSKKWISSDSRYNLKLCCKKKKIVRLRQRAYHT